MSTSEVTYVDRKLQIQGDGSEYELVEKNVSFDGGHTYEIINEMQIFNFQTVKGSAKASTEEPNFEQQNKPQISSHVAVEVDLDEPIDKISSESVKKNPTDLHSNYPSNKDGTYGYIVQISRGDKPSFERPRGKSVFYFDKIGNEFVFTNAMIPVQNSRKKLPPDITSLFQGPDGQYYFIREDAYCRRPLNVNGVGLDPPDYCPEGGDLRELLGCNLRFYAPEVDDLCQNPLIDHSVMAPDNQSVWLIRGKDIWLLKNLPTNPKANPSKCILERGGDATKIWKKFDLGAGALFLIEHDDKKKPELVQFHNHRFTVWNFEGGEPLYEGQIKELPNTESRYIPKPQTITEKPAIEEVEKERSIVYKDKSYKLLCEDPTIDSADSNLDGTAVYLFKGDQYYLMKGLKEKGVGKLVKHGKTKELLENFNINATAVMTCKEGITRGHIYEYLTLESKRSDRKQIHYKSWNFDRKPSVSDEELGETEAPEIDAAFHNRNVSDPVMIAIKDDEVFYYSTIGNKFAAKRRRVKHYESYEKLPKGVTAAFSLPNQNIYLFREKHVCVRGMVYNDDPPYCPQWRDSRELFGCFGKTKPITQTSKATDNLEALKDLCSDPVISDADISWEREDKIFVWRKSNFWEIDDFPHSPHVVRSGITKNVWKGFSDNPDAVVIVQEGKKRRGWLYATFGGYWSSWYPNRKPWVGYKAWWGQPSGSRKFGAMMHNGDIKNALVLGFDGSYVHSYTSDGTILDHKGRKKVNESNELWPKDLTAAFRLADNAVYLFRKNVYCKRNWDCKDRDTNCCHEWIDVKELFGCPGVKHSDHNSDKDTEDSKPESTDSESETAPGGIGVKSKKSKRKSKKPIEPTPKSKASNLNYKKKTTGDKEGEDGDETASKKKSKKSRLRTKKPILPTPKSRRRRKALESENKKKKKGITNYIKTKWLSRLSTP